MSCNQKHNKFKCKIRKTDNLTKDHFSICILSCQVQAPHCSRSGSKIDLRSQQKFQWDINFWCKSYQKYKIQKNLQREPNFSIYLHQGEIFVRKVGVNQGVNSARPSISQPLVVKLFRNLIHFEFGLYSESHQKFLIK